MSTDSDLRPARIESVDLVRGLVMILMALDHVRFYFTNVQFPPEDMERTTVALFLTRWVTHFCAPAFFLLAGTSAFLSRGNDDPERVKRLPRFLVTRGVWLIVLELTVIGYAWTFVPGFGFAGVIWALGWSMILLALFVRLPVAVAASFGVAVILPHNLLDGITPADLGGAGWLWPLLHGVGGTVIPGIGRRLNVLYSLLPWAGVMAAGYGLGVVFRWDSDRRRRFLIGLGSALVVLFLILRLTNSYGNPAAPSIRGAAGVFEPQATLAGTFIALLNVEKYPASLQFLLMTLGPALVLLAAFERPARNAASKRLRSIVVTFGRVPMLYYVLHLFLIHLLAWLTALALGQPSEWLGFSGNAFGPRPEGYGHGLPVVYLMTVIAVVCLYFPCSWFAALKARRKDWWLGYL